MSTEQDYKRIRFFGFILTNLKEMSWLNAVKMEWWGGCHSGIFELKFSCS